jgi:acetylornithine deacetylase
MLLANTELCYRLSELNLMVSDDLRRLLTDLVAFDTTSRHSNLELIDYVQQYLRRYGVDSELVFD